MTDVPLRATISLRGVIGNARGEALVVRRATDGGWELPGGRLDRDEDAVDGLEREIEEETALDVDVGAPVHTNAWRNGDDRGRFAVYYFCSTAERAVSLSAEHDEYAWDGPTAAIERLSETQARAVERATGETGVTSATPSVELR